MVLAGSTLEIVNVEVIVDLFQGLKRIYTHEDSDSDDGWTDEEGDEDVVHTDDEDVKPEMEAEAATGGGGGAGGTGGGDEAEEEDDNDEDWASEDYGSETLKQLKTPLDDASVDEFAIFKQTILTVQQHDPEWWSVLFLHSSETDKVRVVIRYYATATCQIQSSYEMQVHLLRCT